MIDTAPVAPASARPAPACHRAALSRASPPSVPIPGSSPRASRPPLPSRTLPWGHPTYLAKSKQTTRGAQGRGGPEEPRAGPHGSKDRRGGQIRNRAREDRGARERTSRPCAHGDMILWRRCRHRPGRWARLVPKGTLGTSLVARHGALFRSTF